MRAPPARKGRVHTVSEMMRSVCARTSGNGTIPLFVAIIGIAGWHRRAGPALLGGPFAGACAACIAAPAALDAASTRPVLVRKSRRRIGAARKSNYGGRAARRVYGHSPKKRPCQRVKRRQGQRGLIEAARDPLATRRESSDQAPDPLPSVLCFT